MRRRQFIAGLGSAVAWPVVARAQQRERMRQVGMLVSGMADDIEFQAFVGAFQQGLAQSARGRWWRVRSSHHCR
jgi:putative ABC transport system substrate-binding protein